jgi:drug/metabolite transporter (DMT)-like permease
MNDKSITKGVISALIGFFFLALIGVMVKLAGREGAKLGWIVFIQYATAFLLSFIISARVKFQNLKPANFPYELLRGMAGVASFFCFVFAMAEIPLVDASLLQNTAPIFIPIIGLIWLKDSVDKKIWLGILIGFVGIILIIKPDSSIFKTGDLLGLASGVLLALGYVAMKVITKTDSFKTILFYFSAIAFVLSLPFGIINWSSPTALGWFCAGLSGVLLVAYLNMLQFAYRHAEPNRLSPFNYSVVVFIGLFDWWLFGHVPDLLTVIGIIIVSAGGIITILMHEKKNPVQKHSWH